MPAPRAIRAVRSRGGHATVELVLALPVLMIFVLGVADVGRVMTASAELHRALASGAARAIDKTLPDSSIAATVVKAAAPLVLTPAAITVTRGGDSLVVSASTTVRSFTPGARYVWPNAMITVSGAAVTRVTP
jgi:Flp pilus assembly protein TadG